MIKHILALALTLAVAPTTIQGEWVVADKDYNFDLRQEGSTLVFTPHEMPPEIYAGLGSMEIPGTIQAEGASFEAQAHLDRKGVKTYHGRDTCDVLYTLHIKGTVLSDTKLQVDECTYEERFSCQMSRHRGLGKITDCNGVWFDPWEKRD